METYSYADKCQSYAPLPISNPSLLERLGSAFSSAHSSLIIDDVQTASTPSRSVVQRNPRGYLSFLLNNDSETGYPQGSQEHRPGTPEVLRPERPFPCRQCGRRFKQKPHRDSHEIVVHDKSKNFKCQICFRAFGNNSNLKRHIRCKHQEQNSPSGVHHAVSTNF